MRGIGERVVPAVRGTVSWNSKRFQEFQQTRRGKVPKKRLHPVFIRAGIFFSAHLRVADIAAAAACDQELSAYFGVVVKKRHAVSGLCRSQSRKNPRRTCPNDRNLHDPIIQRKACKPAPGAETQLTLPSKNRIMILSNPFIRSAHTPRLIGSIPEAFRVQGCKILQVVQNDYRPCEDFGAAAVTHIRNTACASRV